MPRITDKTTPLALILKCLLRQNNPHKRSMTHISINKRHSGFASYNFSFMIEKNENTHADMTAGTLPAHIFTAK